MKVHQKLGVRVKRAPLWLIGIDSRDFFYRLWLAGSGLPAESQSVADQAPEDALPQPAVRRVVDPGQQRLRVGVPDPQRGR